MLKKNTIILFILSILFFSLSLVGVYALAQNPGHSANQVGPGSFVVGDYTFPGASRVGVGTEPFEGTSLSVDGVSTVHNPGSSTGTVSITSPGGNPGIVFRSNDPELYRADIERRTEGLSFDVHANTTNPQTSLFIANGGNVGIGTTSPSQKLDVAGTALASNFSTAGSVTGAIFYDNDDTAYYVDPAGTNSKLAGNIFWGSGKGLLSIDQGASIELGGSGTPYVDFSNDKSSDYDMRLILAGNDELRVQGGNLTVVSNHSGVGTIGIGGGYEYDFWYNGGNIKDFYFTYTGNHSDGATLFNYYPSGGSLITLFRIENDGEIKAPQRQQSKSTTVAHLKTHHAGCNDSSLISCITACHRHCVNDFGYSGGTAVEHDGTNVTCVCIP